MKLSRNVSGGALVSALRRLGGLRTEQHDTRLRWRLFAPRRLLDRLPIHPDTPTPNGDARPVMPPNPAGFRESPVKSSLRSLIGISGTCLSRYVRGSFGEDEGSPPFLFALGEPRATLGTHVATLAFQHGIDVGDELRNEPSFRGRCVRQGAVTNVEWTDPYLGRKHLMSYDLTSTFVWQAEKSVGITGHSRHRHSPSPIAMDFNAPGMCKTLTFGPAALAGSIARTATLLDAPPEMLARWGDRALTEVEWLIENGTKFALTQHFHSLADADRAAFAGRVGAGVTDLLMNALGYAWRDNAACLSSGLSPHADFIYGDGAVTNHGVVLAEARGSFAANISAATITRVAQRKYSKQVKPHLAVTSPYGKVIHGYSIAFGSRPGAVGAFLHAAETRISKQPGRRPPLAKLSPGSSPESIPTSLALASHRANFSLMYAPGVVAWIDWVRAGGERPDGVSPLSFMAIPYEGRTFLASAETFWPFLAYPDRLGEFCEDPTLWLLFRRRRLLRRSGDVFAGWFVMEERSAKRFLDSLATIIRNGRENMPAVLELPLVEPSGFAMARDEVSDVLPESEYGYALYRDGLALLGSLPPRRKIGHRLWTPEKGLQSD